MNKNFFKITGALSFACALCAFLLSFVYESASQRIRENEEKRITSSIEKLAPRAKKIELLTSVEDMYRLENEENQLVGYAFLAKGQGYQGKITLLGVTGPDLKYLIGIEVIESVETPGLGSKIRGEEFKKQFEGLNISDPLSLIKEKPVKDNQIKAITGATVSSKSVVNILNKRIEQVRQKIN
ncbi:MAG: FMN-binding protein [Candidatus Omnitrophica bacterium]|nr:FMN-binding protein [Candidatus Omnitrophota bacterium]MBD3268943.1 FMN-binding protein [Candidatus Omnitrophota bacterium]